MEIAKSMPQWPHRYVLREDGSAREFDFINRLIKRFGYLDKCESRTKYSFVMGRFRYWVDEDCLNRGAPISNEEVRKRGLRYCARHGKKNRTLRKTDQRQEKQEQRRSELTIETANALKSPSFRNQSIE